MLPMIKWEVMDNIVGRLQSSFPNQQLQLILGSLMGDARLECRSKEIRQAYTARLRIHQSDKQKDYVFWKYQMLRDFVQKGPRYTKVWHDPKRNKDHYSWYFHTKTNESFGEIHKLFYKNGIKIVPPEVLETIEPFGLAVWYMDDGSNNGSNITLNTHSFSLDEQESIQRMLQMKFNVASTIVKDRNKLKIAIRTREFENFLDVVRPYVIPSMNYKIASPRNDLSQAMRQAAIL